MPIWVEEVTPRKTGTGLLSVTFYHANYATGVQDKVYGLRVFQRFDAYLVALRQEKDEVYATVILEPISRAWVLKHFPQLIRSEGSDDTLSAELDLATDRVAPPARD